MKSKRLLIDVVTGVTLCGIFVAAGYAILSPRFTSFGTPSADADLFGGYDCNLGTCTYVSGGGAYPDHPTCTANCPVPYRTNCTTHVCEMAMGDPGAYSNFDSCQAALPGECPYFQLDCLADTCSPITIAGSGWSTTIYNTESQCNDARNTCQTWVVDCANPARCISGPAGATGAGSYRDLALCGVAAGEECSYYKIDCTQEDSCVAISSSEPGSYLTKSSCDPIAMTTCGATMNCANRSCTQNYTGEYATQASCTAAIGSVCTTYTANCSTGECDETLAETTPLGSNSFSTLEACTNHLATCARWDRPSCGMPCVSTPGGPFTDFAECMAAPNSSCSSSSSSTPQCCNLDTGMCQDI